MAPSEDNTPSEDVEDIIALWCLRYAALSNVELAHLSNCSRRWRQATHHAVIEQSYHPRVGEKLLLLPSMVRYFMKSEAKYNARIQVTGNSSPPGASPANYPEKHQEPHHDTFCAAWFDPDGIQELRISLSNNGIMSVSDEDLCHNNNQSSKSSPLVFGEPLYEVSDNDDANKDDTRSSRSSRKQQNRHPQRSTAAFSKMSRSNGVTSPSVDDRVVTCYEWQGYSTAMDVLCHFGYSNAFIKEIFNALRRNTVESSIDTPTNGSHHSAPHDSESLRSSDVIKQIYRSSTYAVRGAVIARPESYCDCVDLAVERLRKIRFAAAANDNEDEFNNIRVQEYKQSLIRKEIRRRQLQRDVLPRIVTRSFVGPPDVKSKRCVQFLNASGGHAVCMLTPPFACGPLVEPVTVLCVGIATEDGCFLSGLHHRFELGHLYPSNEIDEIAEQSPVCISTECWSANAHPQQTRHNQNGASTNNLNEQSIHTCEEDDVDRDGDEDADEDDYRNGDLTGDADDDSYGNSSEEAWISRKCDCSFKGVGEKISALDEGKPRIIHRGHLGPGAWHCYVAVFDGEQSLIRIDGVSEPMQTEHLDGDVNTPRNRAMLDGLTIGSDHCFGMSLCCGNGSGGEGEGAIAELAVFQGRLALDDIQALEKKLMERHGLVSPHDVPWSDSIGTAISLWRENDYARQAHALFFLPETDDGITNLPSSSSRPSRIPLRFLSQHRSVAWKQTNPVTGEPIHVHRIGCKPGAASSSDL
jgi:hypothetical protein